jgi:hypothetical protein
MAMSTTETSSQKAQSLNATTSVARCRSSMWLRSHRPCVENHLLLWSAHPAPRLEAREPESRSKGRSKSHQQMDTSRPAITSEPQVAPQPRHPPRNPRQRIETISVLCRMRPHLELPPLAPLLDRLPEELSEVDPDYRHVETPMGSRPQRLWLKHTPKATFRNPEESSIQFLLQSSSKSQSWAIIRSADQAHNAYHRITSKRLCPIPPMGEDTSGQVPLVKRLEGLPPYSVAGRPMTKVSKGRRNLTLLLVWPAQCLTTMFHGNRQNPTAVHPLALAGRLRTTPAHQSRGEGFL